MAKQLASLSRPLLMIGVGGFGIRAAKQVRETLLNEYSPEKLRFLVVDVDPSDGRYAGFEGDELCILSSAIAPSALAPGQTQRLPSYFSDWLHPQVCGSQPSRQASRFCLLYSVQSVLSNICFMLKQLYDGSNGVEVMIAASLAGNTGSGCLLDMAYLVRLAADQLHIPVKLTALLGMPDIHTAMAPHIGSLMRAIAFAALKELDYWMDCNVYGEPFVQQYAAVIRVEDSRRPFDTCFLISGSGASNPIAAATEMIAHFVCMAFRQSVPANYFSYRDNVDVARFHLHREVEACRRYSVMSYAFQPPVSNLQPHELCSALSFCENLIYPVEIGNATTLCCDLLAMPAECKPLLSKLLLSFPKAFAQLTEEGPAERLHIVDGVSLYQYGPFMQCETDYESLAKDGVPGLHLWQSAKKNWADLPCPIPTAVRGNTPPPPSLQAAHQRVSQLIDRMTENGGILWNDDQATLLLDSEETPKAAMQLRAMMDGNQLSADQVMDAFKQISHTCEPVRLMLPHAMRKVYAQAAHPERCLLRDMLLRRPRLLRRLEQRDAEDSELREAVNAYASQAAPAASDLARRVADLLAFGLLIQPTPFHVCLNTPDAPLLYNVMRDDARYCEDLSRRPHMSYRIALKLADMEKPDHPEHELLAALKQLENALAQDLLGDDFTSASRRLEDFMRLAPTLSRDVDNALAQAMYSAQPRNEAYLAFLREMCEAVRCCASSLGVAWQSI